MTDLDKVIAFIRKTLLDPGELKSEEERPYSSLPLCVIDAVYSMGVRYESTERTVMTFCRWAGWNDDQEYSVSELCSLLRPYHDRWVSLASEVFRNRQRTSSRSGIHKAQAVYLFAATLQNFRVDLIADLARIDLNGGLSAAISAIPGQASGICFKYFLMLAQQPDLVKPDRMLTRFVADALAVPSVEPNVAEALVKSACQVLQREVSNLRASRLDYAIWQYQRQVGGRRDLAHPTMAVKPRLQAKHESDRSQVKSAVSTADTLIRCYICPQHRQAPEGLEAAELYVCRGFESQVEKPELHNRTNILLRVGSRVYRGGLRTYPSKRGEVYVCPDLQSESGGIKISLAKVLKDSGFAPKTEVEVRIEKGVWEILRSANKTY